MTFYIKPNKFVMVNKNSIMYTYYFVLLVLRVFYSCCIILDENPTLENDIISNIISKFNDHNVIFHFDESSKLRTDSIISTAHIKGTVMMQNYQLSAILIRPTGFKFLHVILLKKYTQFKEYTQTSDFCLTHDDVLFFVIDVNDTNDNTMEINNFTYWRGHQLDKAGSMFVLSIWNLMLYTVCFYCGKNKYILQNIAILSDNVTDNYNVSVSLVQIHKNQFNNFNGNVFDVAYTIYNPFFWARVESEDNSTGTVEIALMGSEAALIYTLYDKLNMIFYMEEFNNTENNWNKLVEAVANNSFDFAMGGITQTNQRMEIVDFTSPINTEAYTVLYSVYDDPWMSWQNVVIPFDFLVWLTLFLIIFVISCLFAVAVKLTDIEAEWNILHFFRNCLRLLVEQSVPKTRLTTISRASVLWLLILWLLVALITTNCYKSKLTSMLITSRAEEFDSIDELVENKYRYFINSEDSYVIREYLENSDDQNFLETLKQSINDTEFCESILQTAQRYVAVIDEETNFQYGIDSYCPEVTSSDMFSNLRLTHSPLYSSTHAWPMQKNAPFRASVNRVIARLHAGGLFLHWSAEYGKIASTVRKSHQRQNRDPVVKRFTLAHMLGPGIIWGLGMLAAAVCLLVEVVPSLGR